MRGSAATIPNTREQAPAAGGELEALAAAEEFSLQMSAFGQAASRPAMQGRASQAVEDGLQQRSHVELRLGEYVGQLGERKQTAGVQEVFLPYELLSDILT